MDKINAMVEVNTDLGEVPVDVTCPWSGANLIMKVKKVSGFPNYDDCKFQGQSAIPDIDSESTQTRLFEEMNDLNAIIAPDQFETHEKLTATFKKIMGTSAAGGIAAEASKQADAIANELEDFDSQMAEFETQPAETKKVEKAPATQPAVDSGDGLDDLLDGLDD